MRWGRRILLFSSLGAAARMGLSACGWPLEQDTLSPDSPAEMVPPLSPDTVACVCPGLPGRVGLPCSADPNSEHLTPVDGAFPIELPACNPEDAIFLGSNRDLVCRFRFDSNNRSILVFDFTPTELAPDPRAGSTVEIEVQTAALDPDRLNPPANQDVFMTVVRLPREELLFSGTVRVSTNCPY